MSGMMQRVGSLLVALSVISAGSAFAHDTWLAPDRFHLRRPGSVTLSLTSGMEFPKLDHAIKSDRIADAKARSTHARTEALPVGVERAHALTFRTRTQNGVTAFWTVLHPRPSQLKAEQVPEYVQHLGISDAEQTIERWRKQGSTGVTYRYTKYAKTFVRVGSALDSAATGRDAWATPAGLRLELVPESDPTRLIAGSTLRLVLLDAGQPRARYPVSVVHGGATTAYVTDDGGHVTVDIRGHGPYLVRAATLERSPIAASEWDVHFTTLTFEAHSRR